MSKKPVPMRPPLGKTPPPSAQPKTFQINPNPLPPNIVSVAKAQSYSGPLPSPEIMEEFKKLGVLDDIMTDFRETSKAMNMERTARANEIQTHSDCEKRLTTSRCRNDLISNLKHCFAVFIILGFMGYLGYQGIELLKAGSNIAGGLILGGGFFGVLTVIVRSHH